MNTVIVESWSDVMLASARIIRRSFHKTKHFPLQPPSTDKKFLGNACVSSLQCGTGKKSQELESMFSEVYTPAKLSAKRTCDERVIIRSQKNLSRNIFIRSAAYNAVYKTLVIPGQQLKDIQQDIDNQKKIKMTQQMNPLKTWMNPDSSSSIHVIGEAHARARKVEDNTNKSAQEKLAKKAATEKRNSTARDNRAKTFRRVFQNLM